jgi:hypothetical protein
VSERSDGTGRCQLSDKQGKRGSGGLVRMAADFWSGGSNGDRPRFRLMARDARDPIGGLTSSAGGRGIRCDPPQSAPSRVSSVVISPSTILFARFSLASFERQRPVLMECSVMLLQTRTKSRFPRIGFSRTLRGANTRCLEWSFATRVISRVFVAGTWIGD